MSATAAKTGDVQAAAVSRCPWTGVEFEPAKSGGYDKVFADAAARAEAHKAARRYTNWLLDAGHLTWEQLRRWSDRQNSEGASYTARPTPPDPEQPPLPLEDGRTLP